MLAGSEARRTMMDSRPDMSKHYVSSNLFPCFPFPP